MTTIKIRLLCAGHYGCNQISDIDYNIDETSLKKVLSGDSFMEGAYIFGGIICPNCGSSYAFKPSRLKSMIISNE